VGLNLNNRTRKGAALKDTNKLAQDALLLVAVPLVVAILLLALTFELHFVEAVSEKSAEVSDVEIASTRGATVVATKLQLWDALTASYDFAVAILARLRVLDDIEANDARHILLHCRRGLRRIRVDFEIFAHGGACSGLQIALPSFVVARELWLDHTLQLTKK
jgi:hypothetical protein